MCRKDEAKAVEQEFFRYYDQAQQNNNPLIELHFQLNYLKTLKSNIRTVQKFDVRDLKKFELEGEP